MGNCLKTATEIEIDANKMRNNAEIFWKNHIAELDKKTYNEYINFPNKSRILFVKIQDNQDTQMVMHYITKYSKLYPLGGWLEHTRFDGGCCTGFEYCIYWMPSVKKEK